MFPETSLKEALSGIVGHVKDVFVCKLREKLNTEGTGEMFWTENTDTVLVTVRTVYSVATGLYGTKMEALEYVKNQHPEFSALAEYVKNRYLKTSN